MMSSKKRTATSAYAAVAGPEKICHSIKIDEKMIIKNHEGGMPLTATAGEFGQQLSIVATIMKDST